MHSPAFALPIMEARFPQPATDQKDNLIAHAVEQCCVLNESSYSPRLKINLLTDCAARWPRPKLSAIKSKEDITWEVSHAGLPEVAAPPTPNVTAPLATFPRRPTLWRELVPGEIKEGHEVWTPEFGRVLYERPLLFESVSYGTRLSLDNLDWDCNYVPWGKFLTFCTSTVVPVPRWIEPVRTDIVQRLAPSGPQTYKVTPIAEVFAYCDRVPVRTSTKAPNFKKGPTPKNAHIIAHLRDSISWGTWLCNNYAEVLMLPSSILRRFAQEVKKKGRHSRNPFQIKAARTKHYSKRRR